MSTDIGVVILSGALPLLGVVIGSGSTILVQRSSARESRLRAEAERRQAQRAEIKDAIESYLKVAQHLQSQLWSREHGGEVLDIPSIIEQVWLAHAHVDIICSERLRTPLTEHALALHDVARHEEQYLDYWAYILPRKLALHDTIRKELSWQGDEAFIEPQLSLLRDQVLSERNHGSYSAVAIQLESDLLALLRFPGRPEEPLVTGLCGDGGDGGMLPVMAARLLAGARARW